MAATALCRRIHRAERIEIYSFDRAFIAALVARLERRMDLTLSVADRHVLVAFGGAVVEGNITTHRLGTAN